MTARLPIALVFLITILNSVSCSHSKKVVVGNPKLPIGFLDAPHANEVLRGVYPMRGFAVCEGGVREVDIYVDREFVGSTQTGIDRKDLVKPFPTTENPGQGGWEYQLNSFSLLPGTHEILVNAVSKDGAVRTVGAASVNVER